MFKHPAWLDRFLGTSPFSALLALTGVMVGALSSVYAQEIKDGYSNWIFWAFIGCCVTFWLLWYWRDQKVTQQREYKEKALEDVKDELLETIRTMPPVNMLDIYGEIYLTVSELIQEVDNYEDSDPEKLTVVEGTIRFTLDGICSLIAAFDNYPKGAQYSANLMEFIPIAKLREDGVHGQILERLKFVLPRTTDGLAGVLDLLCELSCSTRSGDSDVPDDSLTPMALPVPTNDAMDLHGKTRFLPGAPASIAHGSYLIENTDDIAKFVEDKCDVSPSVVHEVREYMHHIGANGIKSWLSIRIGKDTPKAVININSSRTFILKDQKQLYTALSLFVVFSGMIERLLEKRALCVTLQREGVQQDEH